MKKNYKDINKILELYRVLRRQHGHPQGQWSLWCKRPKTLREKEEVVIGAILAQRTNWRNVESAITNLKKARIDSLQKIANIKRIEKRRLVLLIKPSGFKNQKAECLINTAKLIIGKYGSLSRMAIEPIPKLRQELLSVKGIGPETADSILLYALEKPAFVIDEYTRRILNSKFKNQKSKFRYLSAAKYEDLRRLFENNLRRDYRLYQDLHALIVIEGKSANGGR